jgi:hypothetical protein
MSEIGKASVALLVIIMLVSTGSIQCGSRKGDVVQVPVEDIDMVKPLAEVDLPKFVEHYKTLHDESRPPSDEEFGYWTAKYENAVRMWELLLSRVTTGSSFWKFALDIGKALFGTLVL